MVTKLIEIFVLGQGLIDMKDFKMKKQIDAMTKKNPQIRHQKLTRFLQQLKGQREAQEDLNNWQMNVSDDLLRINGRVLEPVKIFFNNQEVSDFSKILKVKRFKQIIFLRNMDKQLMAGMIN